MGFRVAVAGASGYAGGELLRLVAGHPELELAVATAGRHAGARLADVHPHLPELGSFTLAATDPELLSDADLVFLALPHGESAALAAQLPEQVKVVDLGADHRLRDPEAWRRWYGDPAGRGGPDGGRGGPDGGRGGPDGGRGEHPGAWVYGLPELPGQRAAIGSASRVAGTGCYAAAIILALAPLVAAGLVEPEDVVVVAASGTSGAGREARPHLTASEVMGDLSPYRVGAHQHVPEVKQATGVLSLSFTPVLAPMPRGILATVTARPAATGIQADGIQAAGEVRGALAAAYAGEPFVRVLPDGVWPHTGATLGANSCLLQATVDADSGRVIVVSALDNLGKGAAGQAIQCANLMLGLAETAGLSANGVAP